MGYTHGVTLLGWRNFLTGKFVHAFCNGSIAARLLLFRGELCTADSSISARSACTSFHMTGAAMFS